MEIGEQETPETDVLRYAYGGNRTGFSFCPSIPFCFCAAYFDTKDPENLVTEILNTLLNEEFLLK